MKGSPRPAKVNGAIEKANLKTDAGPGRPKKTEAQRKADAFMKDFSRKLLMDPLVRRHYLNKGRSGKLAPQELNTFSAYGFGPPPREGEQGSRGPTNIAIIFKLRDELPSKTVVTLPPAEDVDE